jgi:hypothetical protein
MSKSKHKRFSFEVWQEGICVASVEGPEQNRVEAEGMHYASQYAQDGPIQIKRTYPSTPSPEITHELD